jgi:hypothetical protein
MNTSFISGTTLQWAWDSTSLGLLKECPRKYQYTLIQGYVRRGVSVHLTFGIHFHSGLETYDKIRAYGYDHDDAVAGALLRILHDTNGWESDHPAKNRQNLIRSIIWYLEEYRDDPAQTIILANGKPAVELSFRMETEEQTPDGRNYMLSGHMDRMVKYAGQDFVMDRKTSGSSITSHFFSQFNPDNQMTLYTLAGRVVFDTEVSGVIIDGAQIAVGFTSFGRGITMRSNEQLDEWMQNTAFWFRQAEWYADEKFYPMNEKACGNYGGCPFRNVCSQDERVRKKFLETDFEIREWNPLIPRNDD